MRLLVVAHTGISWHRGIESTVSIILNEFTRSTMSSDASAFVAECIHCIISKTGQNTSFTLFDGSRFSSEPGFASLFNFHGAELLWVQTRPSLKGRFETLDLAASCKIHWRWIAFSINFALDSYVHFYEHMDHGSGFTFQNLVMNDLSEKYKIRHMFPVAYSP